MDVVEEVSVFVYNVDTVVVRIRYQDVTPAVCGDVQWTEGFLRSRGRTGVSKAEFTGRADHHYCKGVIVRHADIQVLVFTEVFSVTTKGIKWLTLVVPLDTLFFCEPRVTHNF